MNFQPQWLVHDHSSIEWSARFRTVDSTASSPLLEMDSEPFRVVLLRRLRMPLPLSVRRCSCGRILDPFGHHRAACSTVGVLSRRGFAVENASGGWSTGLHEHFLARPGFGPESSMRRSCVTSKFVCSSEDVNVFLQESGFDAPEWQTLFTSLPRALAAVAVPEQGWQHVASLVVEQRFVNTVVVPRASHVHRAMLRSQGSPLSGLPLTTLPLSPLHRFDPHLFRVLLLRRLHLPLPLSSRLLVWPSTRLPWPSPCKVLEGRGSWEARLRTGVCCGSGMPRGRRQSLGECVLARSTFWTNDGSR